MAKIYTTEEVVEQFKKVHGNRYDYSKYKYPGRKNDKGTVICKKHGEFQTSRMHHARGVGCPHCAGVPPGGFEKKTKEQFIEEAKKIFGDIYDYSKFVYKNNTTNGIIVCPIHGEFEKSRKHHISRKQGCPACSGKMRLTIEEIRKRTEYIIPEQNYENNKSRIIAICPKHGEWEVVVGNLINNKTRCPSCAGIISNVEQELKDYIDELKIEYLGNDKKILGDKRHLDVYIPTHNLAIEMNGLYHHSEDCNKNPKNKDYHLSKTEICRSKNIQLLHIFEDEWKNDIKRAIWKSMIKNKLGLSEILYGRLTSIREVSDIEKNTFLTKNHLQGNIPSSVNLGLYTNNNQLVAILAMGKNRYNNNYEWEILRYCNLLDHSVIGGFQRLLKYFIENYKPTSIITYADKRFFNGDLYKNAGFEELEDTPPSYFYFKRNELIRYSRSVFQKHKLADKLENYNEILSESENMRLNGYCKIWDCGNKKFVKHFDK